MCGKCLQIAEVFSDQGYNNSLADKIKLWKDSCETSFSLCLLSVILFVQLEEKRYCSASGFWDVGVC